MGHAPLVLLAAALAGLTTLAAELLWIRGLGRGMGTTYEAVAVVAGLLLAGLGIGAWGGARKASASERPARTAAVCMLLAGTWTALSPLYVAQVPGLHVALLDTLGVAGGGGMLPALLLAAPLVVPPSVWLGWTFPYLVRARVLDLQHAGSRASGVYGANTLGAVLGVVGVVVLMPGSGETATLRIAGGLALAGALVLLLIDRPLPHGAGPPRSHTPDGEHATGRLRLVLAASGAAALMAQMAWLRLLQPLAGAHLLGAALLLGPLLLALTIGASLAGPIADRVRRPAGLLPFALAGAGVLTLLSLPLAGTAPLRLVNAGEERVTALVLSFLLTTGPATVLFGAVLPAAVRLRSSWTGSTAGPAGRLYACNALGALAGSVAAGAWLLPRIGAERTLLAAGTLVIAVAVLVRWRIREGLRRVGLVLCAAPLAVLLWPGVLATLLASGPSVPALIVAGKPAPPGLALADARDLEIYAAWFGGRHAQRVDATAPVPAFEGRGGRITLIEEPSGDVGLRRGVLRESVFDPDRSHVPSATEYALGLLPALTSPTPRRALVIGHGAGWTTEAVLAACDADVDVAEIDPAVLAAARAWRGLETLAAEAGGRARIIRADGRVLMRRAARRDDAERYDLIASQPSHPWHPASGHLFTQEAFEAAREALAPRGVLAQWLAVADMTPGLLTSALGSFRAAFEHAWVFRFPGEVVLLGFRQTPHVDAERWDTFFRASNERSSGARLAGFANPGALWKHLVADTRALRRVLPADPGALHDDVPELELTLAHRRLTRAPPERAERVFLRGFPPAMRALLPDAAVRERWLTQAVAGWLGAGRTDEAIMWSRQPGWGTSADGRLVQSRAYMAGGEAGEAERVLREARARWPDRGDVAAAWIAAALARLRGLDQRESVLVLREVEGLVRGAFEYDGRVLAAAARLQRALGNVGRSAALFDRAVTATQTPAPAGVGIQRARLLLSEPHGREEERRATRLLAEDDATYADVDALDMLLRLVSISGDEERARRLEEALGTLQRIQGIALWRMAAGHLARHEFPEALAAAQRARTVWSTQPAAYELTGLTMLCAMASARVGGPPVEVFLHDAVDAFAMAIDRSERPEATRARARRMLGWFGIDTGLIPDRPDPGAE